MRALVTGAGKRIGRALALSLADQGYDVAVHYASSRAEALQTVSDIKAKGRKAVALQADLLREDETRALLPAAAEALGGQVTCLVNNASIFEFDDISTVDQMSWDRHFDSNLKAPVLLTQALAAQRLPEQADQVGEAFAPGLVVNIIDQRVRKLTPEFLSYTLAKSALWTFTQTAAQALAPGVRVNAIGPGPTLRGPRQSEDQFSRQRQATLLGRGSNPQDLTAALVFLLNAPAVTGQLICVDGGQHLAWETADVVGLE